MQGHRKRLIMPSERHNWDIICLLGHDIAITPVIGGLMQAFDSSGENFFRA